MNTTNQKDRKLLTIVKIMMDVRSNLIVSKHLVWPEGISKPYAFFVRQATENSTYNVMYVVVILLLGMQKNCMIIIPLMTLIIVNQC